MQNNLAGCIKNGDITTFSALLADIAPEDDIAHMSLPDDEKQVSISCIISDYDNSLFLSRCILFLRNTGLINHLSQKTATLCCK